MLFLAVTFYVLSTQVVYSINWQHEIYVSTTTGINDTSCWTGGQHTPCATFNLALRGLQHNSTVIYITPGNYILEYGQETQLRYKSQIAIIGKVPNSPGEQHKAIIKCSSFTGLSFLWSEDIILKSIMLHGCGGVQVSTSRNLSSQSFELLMFQVAVYMLYCQNVHIVDVVIESSNGTGLTMYNTVGNVTISGCVFKENGVGVSYGGGGLQIEWSYCNLENKHNCTPSTVDTNNGSLCNIINCSFTFNMAQRGSPRYKLSNQGRDSYVFGNGGGVSVIFKGQASNNKIIMYFNILEDNQADHGGGFYIGYYDNANNNSVEMSHMTVTNNSNPDIDLVSFYENRGGGGGKIVHAPKYDSGIKQPINSITIFESIISNNIGITGGGISVTTGSGIIFFLTEVLLTGNIAYLGSSCYFIKGIDFTQSGTVQITNNTFSSNRPTCDVNTVHSFAILLCSGSLYSSKVLISFNGINTFNDNSESAIEVHGSVITVNLGTRMNFTGNSGSYGGAIALYECSYIVLYNQTKLAFINNTATSKGGAIYSGPCNSQQTQSGYCFIVYYNSYVHPDEWETEMVFFYNKKLTSTSSSIPNAIYVTSLSSCWWPLYPNTTDITLTGIRRTLCWDNWNYTPDNCTTSVHSGLAFLNDSRNISIQPGARFKIDVYDGMGQSNSDKINYCVSSDALIILFLGNTQYKEKYVIEFETTLYQFCNNKKCQLLTEPFYLSITTLGSHPLQANYSVTLQDCEWPFKFEHIKSADWHSIYGCKLSTPGFCCSDQNCFTVSDSQCTVGSYYYSILPGYCLSNYNSNLVIGRCTLERSDSTAYCPNVYTYDIIHLISCVESDVSSYFKYTGRLNGACISNNCVPINSVDYECTDDGIDGLVINLLIVFTIEIVPITILVILIIVLNIKLTNGSLNGYVFFCQIVSISFPIINSVWFITTNTNVVNSITFPHNIWNLNFLNVIPFPVCITPTMGSLGAITFWYVVAAYPFLLLFFLYGWITMYNKGFRCVFTMTQPLHRLLARFWHMTNIEPSLTHSISSIYVLCFTQFAATSLKLLHFTKWYSLTNEDETGIAFYYDGTLDYFGYPHAFLGILAIIILIVVVFIPTVYLLLHPFKWFHKILDWCKLKRPQFVMILVDDYTGAFKNGCNNTNDYRYFAGLYLLLRIVIICLYYIPIQQYSIINYIQISVFVAAGGAIMIFRPYRKNTNNLSEFLILLALAFLNVITIISFYFRFYFSFYERIIPIYFPSFIVILYCIYWIIKKVRCCCLYYKDTRRRSHTDPIEEYIPSDGDDNLFADHVMNPDEYDEHHVSTAPYDHEFPQTPKESTITHYQGTTHHATYGTLTNSTSINSTTNSRHGTTTTSGEMKHLTN